MATGYGVDMWCTDSIFTGRLARGVTLVAQACYRRLITPRGTLRGGPEEENYGLDLAGLVGTSDPDRVAAIMPAMIRGELLKDDRVADVSTTVTYITDTDGTASFTVVIDVALYDDGNDFELTLDVSAVTVKLVGLE